MAEPGFWDNQETAQKVISESNGLKDVVGDYTELTDDARKS